MPPISDYYETDPVTDEPYEPDDTEAVGDIDPARLGELLDRPEEEARKVLRLIDGIEDYAPFPAFPEVEPLLDIPSLEGFRDIVDDIWTAIKRWLTKVKQWLTDDGRWVHASLKTLKFQAENLNISGRTQLSRPRQGLFTIGSHITALSVFYKPSSDIGMLITHLRHLEGVVAKYLTYADSHLMTGMGRITGRIYQLDPVALDTRELVGEMEAYSPRALIHPLQMTPLKRDATALTSAHFLGNHRLVLNTPKDISTLAQANGINLRVRYSELKPRPMPKSIQLGYFGRLQHDQCTKQIIQMARSLEKHTQSTNRRRREATIDELTRMVDRFAEDVKRNDTDLQGQKEQIRQVIHTAKTIADWLHNPYHGMISNAIRSMRGALVVCRANLN